MKIRDKLLTGFLGFIALTILMGGFNTLTLINLRERLEWMVFVNMNEVDHAGETAYWLQRVKSNLREMMVAALLGAGDREKREHARTQMVIAIKQMKSARAEWEADLREESSRRLSGQAVSLNTLAQVRLLEQEMTGLEQTLAALGERLDRESGAIRELERSYDQEFLRLSRRLQERILHLKEEAVGKARQEAQRVRIQFWWSLVAGGVATAIAMIITVLLSRFTFRGIETPLRQLTEVMVQGGEREFPHADQDKLAELSLHTDEIGALTRSYRDLMARVASSRQALLVELAARKKAESELSVALEVAREASEAKSRFLATMSHEIRTPLNGVIGLAGLLQQSELHQHQRECAVLIERSAESLMGLINNVLETARLEAGRLTLAPQPFDLEELLLDVSYLFSGNAWKKGVELTVRVPHALPRLLLGDGERLRQVFNNLVGNAVKFTEQGRILLGVREFRHESGRVALHLVCEDTGIGIPAEKLPHIFEKFTQADATTSRRYGGTGLGLAIAHDLIELMQGKLTVESAEGRGTTFHVTLTLPCSGGATVGQGLDHDPLLQGRRVLVVEDDPVQCAILEEQLLYLGLRVQVSPTAEEALAAVSRACRQGDPYWLVMVDDHLPGTDGFGLARRFRALAGEEGRVSLSLISSHACQWEMPALQRAGFSWSFVKPASVTVLWEGLRELAGFTRALAASPPPAPPDLSGSRILLVDDHEINRFVVRQGLWSLGCLIDEAVNGKEAVTMAAANRYDLILMDMEMPEMDGREATRRIRQDEDPAAPNVIVAFTATALPEERQRCLDLGVNGFIGKPIQLRRLREMVGELVRGRDGAALPLPTAVAAPEPDAPLAFFDPARGLVVTDGDVELYRRMVQAFLAALPETRQRLENTLTAHDGAAYRRVVHTLKGDAGHLGALALARLCQELEQAVREENGEVAMALAAELKTHLDRLAARLVAYLAGEG